MQITVILPCKFISETPARFIFGGIRRRRIFSSDGIQYFRKQTLHFFFVFNGIRKLAGFPEHRSLIPAQNLAQERAFFQALSPRQFRMPPVLVPGDIQ